jgi:hypothetical protein
MVALALLPSVWTRIGNVRILCGCKEAIAVPVPLLSTVSARSDFIEVEGKAVPVLN